MLRMSTPALLARLIPIVVLLGVGVLDAARAAPAMQANTEAAFRLYLPQMRVDLTGAVRPDVPGTIAFVRDGNIYTYHPRTGAIRLLIPNGREVEFSRDGTQLAFVRDDGVYVAAADGSNMRRVVAQTAVSALHWTDDGTKLLWERPLDLDPERWWAGNEIWTLLLADGTATKIAVGFDAAWAPDGVRVAYTTPLPDQYIWRNELHVVTWRGANDWAVVTRLPANTPPIGS